MFREVTGFRPEVVENCTLLIINAALSGHFLPTFREKSLTLEDGTNELYRNLGEELPQHAA
jgi:hypothetical protein